MPDLPVTLEARGIFHMTKDETDESIAAFAKAAEQPNASALAHYGLAVMRFHQARQTDGITPELLLELESRLVSSLETNARFTPAAARLAEVYRRMDGGRTDRALTVSRIAVALEPDNTDYRLLEARILRESGQQDEAQAIVRREADAMTSQGAARLNHLCWQGALWGFAETVLASCDQAVGQQPDNSAFLDSRGVARALTGDLEGALADLRSALSGEGAEDWTEELRSIREAWVAELAQGKNPFAENGHVALAENPLHDGVGWLR
ncbi:MAG: tetratricopeptide repeat protein [Thermoanaerobaculia bacterium]|nr:tetratricopeptide repeat protein [Thermoanaerobaculia bacterium]